MTTDYAMIQDLSARYAQAMDEGRFEDWLKTWTQDGVFEGAAGKFEGMAALKGFVPKLAARAQGKRHFIANHVIELDGASARQTCYLLIINARDKGGVLGSAVYRDELVKIDHEWKFKSRRIEFDPNYPT